MPVAKARNHRKFRILEKLLQFLSKQDQDKGKVSAKNPILFTINLAANELTD